MSRLLSLLAVFLFAFDVSLIAARPQYLQLRSPDPTPVDVSGLNTNAKRFTRGLPPLPALIRRSPTGVQTARRSLTSQCAKSGVIEVFNANTNQLEGYVSKNLKAHQHYTLVGPTDLVDAGIFASTVHTSGLTVDINLLDVNDGSHYFAGLIQHNQQLGDGDGDEKAAILGNSLATNSGDSPQHNKDPSWNNRDTETAIWTYNSADDRLTAAWVNYPGQTPSSTPTYIYWLHNGDKFYLTDSPTPPHNGLAVYFKYISIGDQCPPKITLPL